MSRAITTALLCVAIAAMLAFVGPRLDEIPDHSAEWDQARDLQVAIQQATARQRFEHAAQQLCGPQARWEELPDGSVQCRTRFGKPTITVQVAP